MQFNHVRDSLDVQKIIHVNVLLQKRINFQNVMRKYTWVYTMSNDNSNLVLIQSHVSPVSLKELEQIQFNKCFNSFAYSFDLVGPVKIKTNLLPDIWNELWHWNNPDTDEKKKVMEICCMKRKSHRNHTFMLRWLRGIRSTLIYSGICSYRLLIVFIFMVRCSYK